jgi:hypothetical protein
MQTVAKEDFIAGHAPRPQPPVQLALALGFPVYAAKDWDTFWDCLHTLDELPPDTRSRGIRSLAASFPLEAKLLAKYLDEFHRAPKESAAEPTLS